MLTGTSYFGNRNVDLVIEDLKAIKANSCNAVLHTLAEEDVEYYLDTMKKIVAESHRLGLIVYVNPWGYGGTFGGESYSSFMACNIKARQVDNCGNILPAACLNAPSYREHLKRWVDAAAYVKADIVFWDEPHFYSWHREDCHLPAKLKGGFSCRCDTCRKLFGERFGKDMPSQLTDEIIQFKSESMINFLKATTSYAREKGLKNSVCLLPPTMDQEAIGASNWEDIAGIDCIDEMATDPYWPTGTSCADIEQSYRDCSRQLLAVTNKYNKESQMWIMNFNIISGEEDRLVAACRGAYEEGIGNIFAWSYRGSKWMSKLTCDNPDLVWDMLGAEYRKMHIDR